ncbi:hypothetical protein D3C87_225270 [compost metagenome]
MIKRLFFLMAMAFTSPSLIAQDTLVDFESLSPNVTSFASGARTFTITSQAGGNFMVRQFNGYGWSGSQPDNKFIDNSPAANNVPIKFTITADGSFNLKQMYLYLSDHNGTSVNTDGTVRIVGKLGATEVFNLSASSGFNPSTSTRNGFTLLDFATFGGSGNQTKIIDRFEVQTTGNFEYVALDAMTWSPPSALPVSFGAVTANIQSGKLQVDWSTLSEANNERFIVQGSVDGKAWVDLGTVATKAENGHSGIKLDYSFSGAWDNTVLAGFGILALLLLPASKNRLLRLAILLLVVSAVISCAKETDGFKELNEKTSASKSVYVRLAQVDRDGTKSYSNVVAVKQ